MTLLPDEEVRAFVGEYLVEQPMLDVARPATHGPFAMPDYYFEFRRAQAAALESACSVIAEIAAEYEQLSGRSVGALEPYRLDDATSAIVALGSSAGTIKDTVDELRAGGEPVGLLKIRSFRPLPREELRRLLAHVPEVIVLDRADSPGGVPPLAAELSFALAGTDVAVRSHVYGLGGRDLHPGDVRQLFADAAPRYLGVREEQPCRA